MNALTHNGPATPSISPANPEANPTTLLVIDTPTAKTVHATLRNLQKVINANVGERYHTEADILAVAQALGLTPLSREANARATNIDYGLVANGAQQEEVFFHVCFLPTSRRVITGNGIQPEEGPRMAGFLTIYTHPLVRMGLPLNQ